MINVIDVTDLYHPHQDPGDNVDIIAPYAMEEINLKAIILDVTDNFRQPSATDAAGFYCDENGPREPGIIPVNQLNAIFDTNIPFAAAPYNTMKSIDDKMLWAPKYQQQGIELILKTLRDLNEKADILIFSSLRPVAAAYNRQPELFYEKVNKIHISAGSADPSFIEWNINLDPLAAVRLFKSKLPINIYPCAGYTSPFELSCYNSFWKLENMNYIKNMQPKLKSYLQYVFTRSNRMDFLRAVEEKADESVLEPIYEYPHAVWETAVWLEVSGRKLVKRKSGEYLIIKPDELKQDDDIIKTEMRPCMLSVKDNGGFNFELTSKESNFKIFYRNDPELYQTALNDAFGKWYNSFTY